MQIPIQKKTSYFHRTQHEPGDHGQTTSQFQYRRLNSEFQSDLGLIRGTGSLPRELKRPKDCRQPTTKLIGPGMPLKLHSSESGL